MISRHDHAVLSGRCNPEAGDLLVTKSGTIGRTAVVAPGPPFSLFVSVALVKTLPGVIPEWLKLAFDLWFLSVNVANDITGTAIKNLHLIDLKAISIPLPPRDEQLEILDHWKIHASKLENLITQNESTARLKAALTQSILKSAFSGDLAPQDSTDEPASTLLQRIAAQRAAAVSEASAAKERKSKRGFPSGMTDRKANASTTATRKGKA